MIIEQVNTLALVRAAEAVVGTQVTQVIEKMYQIIDRAMKDGYELGVMDTEKNVEERLDTAFDNGFDQGFESAELYIGSYDDGHEDGFMDGILEASGPEGRAYDEGYLDGVQDARARPAIADDNVVDIINTLMAEAFSQEFDGEAKENKSVVGADWSNRFWDDRFNIDLVRDSGDETK